MGKTNKPSGIGSIIAVAGATLVGAAVGAVATVMSDPKKRKQIEKTAKDVSNQVQDKLNEALTEYKSLKAKKKK